MRSPLRVALLAAGGLAALAVGLGGCGEEEVSRPEDTPTNVIIARYESPADFERAIIELNGERIDLEWGGEFSANRPYTQVRLSSEEGSGSPGATQYASVKALYTDTHLYMLVQWVDPDADQLKDVFYYVGPNFSDPIITCVGDACDTTRRSGPQDSLLLPVWWYQYGEDDKLAIAFQMDATSGNGASFSERGCQVACHPSGAVRFGAIDTGRLDVWYWLAGRTNPIRNLFNPNDDPDDASQGTPGYMDDWYSFPVAGLVPDQGFPGYLKNFDEGAGVPLRPYRRGDDTVDNPTGAETCHNLFNQSCVTNNGLPPAYLWREQATTYVLPFSARDTLYQGNFPADPRRWATGDLVPGYVLTYPSDSRSDVRASGGHEDETGVWTLEIARKLNTGDMEHDVTFEPASGRQYYFTLAIFDADVRNHWGSEPQILRFEPKEAK
jgi:hypothetical protein